MPRSTTEGIMLVGSAGHGGTGQQAAGSAAPGSASASAPASVPVSVPVSASESESGSVGRYDFDAGEDAHATISGLHKKYGSTCA
jgi:hypothetical protein